MHLMKNVRKNNDAKSYGRPSVLEICVQPNLFYSEQLKQLKNLPKRPKYLYFCTFIFLQ